MLIVNIQKLNSIDASAPQGNEDSQVGLMRAICLIRLRRFDDVRTHLEAMSDWPGQDEEIASSEFLIGWFYLQEQNHEGASASFTKVVDQYPNTPSGKKAKQLIERLVPR